MMTDKNISIFKLIANGDYDTIKNEYENEVQYLLGRNHQQNTPLSQCLRYGNKFDWINNKGANQRDILSFLLEKRAEQSIFVKGYLQDSLVCTLPMAQQPPSSIFNWPSPITIMDNEILQQLDNSIALYLENMKQQSDNKKKKDEEVKLLADLDFDGKVESDNGNSNSDNGSETIQKPNSPDNNKIYNFYPNKLKVGDRVRRGVDWTYQDQDHYNGQQCEGIVKKGPLKDHNGNYYYSIAWLSNPKKNNSEILTQNYSYYSGKHSVFRVHNKDKNLFPSNVSKPEHLIEGFKIGDLVSTTSTAAAMQKIKVGAVVEISDTQVADLSGKKDFYLSVMDLNSGQIMKCPRSDLQFADDSALNPVLLGADKLPWSNNNGSFKVGEKVRIRPNAVDKRGCLYIYEKGFVGTVQSIDSTGNIKVHCNDATLPQHSAIKSIISGNYPAHHYRGSDLMSSEFSVPLITGDIVEFNSDFFKSHKDGWCLGSPAEKKRGIVVYGGEIYEGKQRDIVVCALDNTEESYRFRSDWLQRVSNDGTQNRFRIGDRVRIDIGNWNPSLETSQKCLGSSILANYGIVISEGVVRNGIQRNIGVIACTGDMKGSSSFYPSYALVHALERFTVMTEDDVISLTQIVKTLLVEASLSAIDAEKEVKMRRVAIWHYLQYLPTLSKKKIKMAFDEWNSQRSLYWPSDEVNANDVRLDKIWKTSSQCLDTSSTWNCVNPKCLTVGGFQNTFKFSKCRMCNFKAPQWTCEFCSTKNDLQGYKICVTCSVPYGFKKTFDRLFELTKEGTVQEFKDFIDSSEEIKSIVLTAKDGFDNGLLVNAYEAKNTELVRYFFEELKADFNVVVNGYFDESKGIETDFFRVPSLSLIEFAALRNDYEFIEFLVKLTTNDSTGKSNISRALHISTLLGHDLCTPHLINHKDIDLSFESSLLFGSAIFNYSKMESVIQALLSSQTPKEDFITGKNLYLSLKLMNGKPDILEMLSHSFDITKPLVNGWNLLHISAHDGCTETMRFLLSDKVGSSDVSTEGWKFDVNAIIDAGWTAMHLAIFNNNIECLNELLNAKDIDVNIIASSYSPLSLAIAMKHSECIEALLKHDKLDINRTDSSGKSPLHVSAMFGNTDATRRLLSILTVDVNIVDCKGDTSLHLANSYGNCEIVQLLMGHPSVEINQKNKEGLTPIKLAKKYGNTGCLNVMLENMDISDQDSPKSSINLEPLVFVPSLGPSRTKTKNSKGGKKSSFSPSTQTQQQTSSPVTGITFPPFVPSTTSGGFTAPSLTSGLPASPLIKPSPGFTASSMTSGGFTFPAGGLTVPSTTSPGITVSSTTSGLFDSFSFTSTSSTPVKSASVPTLASTSSTLQPPWKAVVDKKTSKTYYWNTTTNETTWTPPNQTAVTSSLTPPVSSVPFTPKVLYQDSTNVLLIHISGMKEYEFKSPEELRFEFKKNNTPVPSIATTSTPTAALVAVPLLPVPVQPILYNGHPFQDDKTEEEYKSKMKAVSSFKVGKKIFPSSNIGFHFNNTDSSFQAATAGSSNTSVSDTQFKASLSPPLKQIATIFANEKKKILFQFADFSFNDEHEKVDDSDDDDANNDSSLTEDYEILKNNEIAEDEFTSPSKITISSVTVDVVDEKDSEEYETDAKTPNLERQGSDTFYKMTYYEPIEDWDELLRSISKDGNTAGHYLAQMRLTKSVEVLLRYGVSEWTQNFDSDTIAGLRDGLNPRSGEKSYNLHKILSFRNLVSMKVLKRAINTPFDYRPPESLSQVIASIKENREDDADYYLSLINDNHELHAKVYRAIFRLEFNYGIFLAKQDLEDYIQDIGESIDSSVLDPIYYYAIYLLWKKNPTNQHAKVERLRAYDSLRALSFFPEVEKLWLEQGENHVQEMEEKYPSDLEKRSSDLEEDNYSDLIPPPGPNDPENVWIQAKKSHKLVSASMDKLMAMIGLKEVKKKTVDLALKTLLSPPPDVKSETSVNLLFVGNSGTGKSTCGTLVAQSLVELGFRKNRKPVMVSASDILGASEPEKEFLQHVQAAENGTLFIDEAGLFDPAPKGSRSNDSNKVLDALMKVSETMKHTTTFILAGYKDDINKIIGYNQGFRSRFPKKFEFEFNDYTEIQLTKIICEMLKQRNLRFASVKECGVPIARVLARRLHKGANKPGFGNGRSCEKELESCIQNMDGRLSRLLLAGVKLTDYDYRVITRGDSIGERPHIEDFPEVNELKSMIGLRHVKESIYNIINLALQNYDAEMRGDPIQEISLHRVFLGNPGTGKTTIAKLFGKILKAFRLLSDGDFIVTTPSDLKGVAVGEAAERTRNLLESAKGKVLFIDEAYNLDAKRHASGGFGKEVIDTIVEKINGAVGQDIAVIFAGYKPQMEEMLRNCDNPGIARRLNLAEAFIFEDFTDDEIKIVLKNQIVNCGLTCEPSTLDFAVKEISKKRMQEMFGNAGEAEQILTHAKLKMSARLSKAPAGSIRNVKLLIQEDFAGEELSVKNAREAFADLMNIDHITEVIDKFEALVTTALDEGRKPSEEIANMHMLFLGPPGTGKTTCAKKFATMMYQLGVLPSKKFEYVTASNLIDRYVGGSGNNMKEALQRAKGGILFIDEAYGMMPAGRHGYGGDLMQVLLDNITTEEYSGKILVILGGYKHQVEELFAFNPGFQSRFDKMRIEFPPWNAKQASDGLITAIERDGKLMTEVGKQALPAYFEALAELPNWGSARDVMDIIKKNLEIERAARSFALTKEKRQLQEALQKGDAPPLRGSSFKQAQPPPIPYELEDVIKVFKNVIASRGGEFDDVDTNNYSFQEVGSVKSVKSKQQLNAILKSAATDSNRILVLCATDKERCNSSRVFEPKFKSVAGMMNDCQFITTDDLGVRQMLRINRTPSVRLFYKNQKLGDDICTENIEVVVNEIRRQWAILSKMKLSTPPPPPANMFQAPSLQPPQAPPSAKHKFLFNERGPNKNDNEEDDEIDVFAELEKACAELGLKPEDVVKLLENKDFPPQEILTIIIRTTGCSDVPKLKKMLLSQRQQVLEKLKFSIKESNRAKSEEEKKVQTALAEIGLCCMGYEWLKTTGGYRCAGGSHFCTDDDVLQQMNK